VAVRSSSAGPMSRSNLPADGTSATSSALSASSQQKPSLSSSRASSGVRMRSPMDGGPRPQSSTGSAQPTERFPVYGSTTTSDRRALPPDGSGNSDHQRSGNGSSRSTMAALTTASASTQVTFQDPIESESAVVSVCGLWSSRVNSVRFLTG